MADETGSALSNYLENALMQELFNGTDLSVPDTYVALFTTTPTDTGGTEVSGGAYARQRVYKNGSTSTPKWNNAAATTSTYTAYKVTNANTVTFPQATANWGDVKGFGIYDHTSTGNLLWHGGLAATKTVNDGDTFKFTTANLTCKIR